MTHQSGTPPRVANWLLRKLLSPEEHATLVGDLDEQYARRRARHGRAAANRHYWRETLAAAGLLAAHSSNPEIDRAQDSFMRRLLVDLTYTLRTLRRSPMYTTVCVLTLGLALGGIAAVISVARPLLFDPVPYANAERLGLIWEADQGGERSNTTFATFKDLQPTLTTIESSAVIGSWEPTLSFGDDAERLVGLRVSANYFPTLGVTPALGRNFAAAEDAPEVSRVVIISHALWMRRFGGDSAAVGSRIEINGASHLLAGVLPPSYDDVLTPAAQIWRVLGYGAEQPWACRTCRHLRMLGRVREGVTTELASQEVNTALTRLAAAHPTEYSAPGGMLIPLRDMVVADVRPILLAVSGAAAILLLFAIVNVTHLQFARAIRREGEFAIRMALGATRLRLTRQLLAEAVVIVLLSTVLGVLVAVAATPMLVSRLPVSLPRLSAVSVDGTTLMLLALIGACSTIVIGTLPSWRTEGALADGLRGGRRAATSMRRSARNALVVTQVALALVLMIGAGLLGRSLLQLYEVDTGFDARNVLTMQVQSTGARYDSTQRIFAHHEALIASVERLPGVVSAGFINQLPMGGNHDSYSVNADDKPLANPELAPSADRYTVSPGFTSTMGIGILHGRALTSGDNRDSAHKVVVVSASLAERIWPGESALGKRIRIGGAPDAPWREVVGIAANVRHDGLDSDRTLQAYVPFRQWIFADDIITLVVRTSVNPVAVQEAIVDAVRRIDPSQPIMHIAPMEQVIARSVAQRRLALELFGAFSLLAVMLAGAGLYGLLAGDVADRTREIGIRVAMGARPLQVMSLVARQATLLLTTGALLGTVAAMALGRYLEALLFGVRTMDVVTLLSVAGALVLVGVLSTLVPVLRALHIEPSVALRYE